jgi:hypothetical protein
MVHLNFADNIGSILLSIIPPQAGEQHERT